MLLRHRLEPLQLRRREPDILGLRRHRQHPAPRALACDGNALKARAKNESSSWLSSAGSAPLQWRVFSSIVSLNDMQHKGLAFAELHAAASGSADASSQIRQRFGSPTACRQTASGAFEAADKPETMRLEHAGSEAGALAGVKVDAICATWSKSAFLNVRRRSLSAPCAGRSCAEPRARRCLRCCQTPRSVRLSRSWKRLTAREANRYLGRTGTFWQTEYWDRFIRNEAHFHAAEDYIDQNPAKAGLAARRALLVPWQRSLEGMTRHWSGAPPASRSLSVNGGSAREARGVRSCPLLPALLRHPHIVDEVGIAASRPLCPATRALLLVGGQPDRAPLARGRGALLAPGRWRLLRRFRHPRQTLAPADALPSLKTVLPARAARAGRAR